MAIPKLPKSQIDMFADIFTFGLEFGATTDVKYVLDVMGLVYPHLPQIVAAQADIALRMGNFNEARRILEEANERMPDVPILKAMMAFCLMAQDDGLWQVYAREAMALPADPAAHGIVMALGAVKNIDFGPPDASSSGPTDHSVVGMAC